MTRRERLVLVGSTLGFSIVLLDTTVVNVALGEIARDLDAETTTLQWVANAYTLVFAGLLLSTGLAADRRGARAVFLAGLATFTVGSVLAALAPTALALILAQAVLGVGAALVLPTSLALLSEVFADQTRRVRAVGFWAAGSAVSFAAGPVVGGLLIEQAGWRSIFVINLPVAAVAAALVVSQVGRRTRPVSGPVTIVPQLAAVAMLVSLTFGLIESGDRGWTSPIVLAALGVAGVLAAALGRRERTAASPLIPRELRADRRFTASTLGGVIINFAFYGELFFLSLYLQQERGLDALETGLVFLPQPLLFMAVAPIAGRLVATRGPRPLLGAGAALGVTGALILLAVDANSSYAVMLLGLAVNGLGGGLAVPAITAGAMGSAPQALAGIASATVNAGRQVGGVLGVAVLGGLATAGGTIEVDGIHRALWLAAAGLALGCLLAYAMPARAASAPAREAVLAHE